MIPLRFKEVKLVRLNSELGQCWLCKTIKGCLGRSYWTKTLCSNFQPHLTFLCLHFEAATSDLLCLFIKNLTGSRASVRKGDLFSSVKELWSAIVLIIIPFITFFQWWSLLAPQGDTSVPPKNYQQLFQL